MTGHLESLETLLKEYRAEILRQMRPVVGVPESVKHKEQLVGALASRIGTKSYVEQAVRGLDAPERATLHRVQRVGGAADSAALQSALVSEGVVKATPTERARSWYPPQARAGDPTAGGSTVFADVAARLALKGLLLARGPLGGSQVVDFSPALRLMIPREVFDSLPPPPPREWARPAVQYEVAGDATGFSRELFVVWTYLWQTQPALLKAKSLLSKRDLRALVPLMSEPRPALSDLKSEEQFRRLYFQRQLLLALDVLAVEGDLKVVGQPDEARRHWELPLLERVKLWLDRWLRGSWWYELDHLPETSWRASYGRTAETGDAIRQARATIIEEITRHAPAQPEWISRAEFLADLRLGRRDFLIPGVSAGTYGYGYGYTPAHRYQGGNRYGWTFRDIATEELGWTRVEVAMVDQVLETLYWFGLLDLGRDQNDALVAFRLTPLGAHLLDAGPPPPLEASEAPAAARVILQPNFHLVAFGPVNEALLLELEQFADRLRVDRAVEYELTRASLYRAHRGGMDAQAVITRLVELTGAELPQNVVRTLHEWQGLYQRILIYPRVNLIQTASEELLDTLVAGEGIRALTPRVALVTDEKRLARALRAADLSPIKTTNTGGANSLDLDDEGNVLFRAKVPDIYLLGRLQQLAEYDPAREQWRLTPAAVKRGRAIYGLDADAQLAAWRELLATAPPAWLAERLRVWSGYYGDARVERPLLIALRDQEALDALRRDSRIAALLKPFKTKRTYAVVAPEQLAKLRALLEEKGVTLIEDDGPGKS